TARAVHQAGAAVLRGGVFKPRTSPYSFKGLGEQALDWLHAVGKSHQMPIITEVMAPEQVNIVADKADILQIGARNMQNFNLLEAVGDTSRPILLKRGPAATLDEWLLAAEYILAQGNEQVILCERGLRSFDRKYTRNILDVSAVPVLKSLTHLPVIVDPSHAVGKWEWITAVSRAAIAAGADGLLVEVHPQPEIALSDGRQSLLPKRFKSLMTDVRHIAGVMGRSVGVVESQTISEFVPPEVLP
ncbi:MAG: 3-deoxy-7-phosphoheptulonate synthase, partial [Candidatus Marinimicrobia bacterium]|nr:3-deoxy-7-phosphoheptulonate synthase [Candidatus Neomarinimicrobiota bacterium]